MNYYQVLQVSPNATQDEIKTAYHIAAQIFHPDRLQQLSPVVKQQAEERLKIINDAYSVLSDPVKRRDYDKSIGIADGERYETEANYPNRDSASSSRKSADGLEQKIEKLRHECDFYQNEFSKVEVLHSTRRRKFWITSLLSGMAVLGILFVSFLIADTLQLNLIYVLPLIFLVQIGAVLFVYRSTLLTFEIWYHWIWYVLHIGKTVFLSWLVALLPWLIAVLALSAISDVLAVVAFLVIPVFIHVFICWKMIGQEMLPHVNEMEMDQFEAQYGNAMREAERRLNYYVAQRKARTAQTSTQ